MSINSTYEPRTATSARRGITPRRRLRRNSVLSVSAMAADLRQIHRTHSAAWIGNPAV
ncbi:MAG: hypothetical protein ACR2OH_08230 [Microthrixaceae bacterium]